MPIYNEMTENDTNTGDEKLLILPLGEESKKITQVISNDTARQIIQLLADAPLSASDIAGRLQVPLTTIVYNLENLENVGLVKVERIKYSEKGREVKIYAPVRKLIVVVPEKTDRKSVTDILRKYIGVILAAVLASSFIEFFGRIAEKNRILEISGESTDAFSSIQTVPSNVTSSMTVNETRGLLGAAPNATQMPTFVSEAAKQPAPLAIQSANVTDLPAQAPVSIGNGEVSRAAPDIFSRIADTITAHPGLVFLLGCIFVIILLAAMDYFSKRKSA